MIGGEDSKVVVGDEYLVQGRENPTDSDRPSEERAIRQYDRARMWPFVIDPTVDRLEKIPVLPPTLPDGSSALSERAA